MNELARFHYEADIGQTMLGPKEHHPHEWTAAFGARVDSLAPEVVRLQLNAPLARLEHVTARLGHGLVVGICRADMVAPLEITSRGTGLLLGAAITQGHATIRTPKGQARIAAGQCLLRLAPPGELTTTTQPGGQQIGGVRFAVDPEKLASDFHIAGGAAELRRAIDGLTVFDMDAAARKVVDQACAVELERPGASLKLEGLMLQFLGVAIEQLMAMMMSPAVSTKEGCEAPSRGARGTRHAQAARQLVALHFDHPPTLAELARRIGTNKNRLSQDFKVLYDETIAQYALRLRMERARSLLLEEGLSASEVAYRVGYQHHSSFTATFAEYWGIPPSALVHSKMHLH